MSVGAESQATWDEPPGEAFEPGVYGERVTERSNRMAEAAAEAAERVSGSVRAKYEDVKPHLRGWLHAMAAPATLSAGVFLIVLSPTALTRVGSTVFIITGFMLFTVSGIYHRGRWGPKTWAFLRRFDHANIFLLIAGSYTPFTLILLKGSDRIVLLSVAWGGAVLGVLFRIFWTHAPRWLYVPIYIALGWAAVFFLGDFYSAAATSVFVLLVVGGGLYTLGGVVYGLKRPDPFPTWFGFHEVFHLFTIAAFITHYVGISIATLQLR